MRAVVQRVRRARVTVDGEETGSINEGLCVLVGAGDEDGDSDLAYVVDKCVNLRVFEDDAGKMNRSVLDIGGGILAISQFTLYGDARKGRRPSFIHAMEPTAAEHMYNRFVTALKEAGVPHVQTGRFRATMDVELTNAGPVTILLDSQKTF